MTVPGVADNADLTNPLDFTGLAVLKGLAADNGATDNWGKLTQQLQTLANAGGGFAILPAGPGYVGVSQDVVPPEGVWIVGRGAYRLKTPTSLGTISYGSGIGPYVNGSCTWTNGVVQLVHKATGLNGVVVIGINGTSTATYANSAPAAVYVGGSDTLNASRIYEASMWGGLTAALVMDSGSDALVVDKSFCINNLFTGTTQVGATPQGCSVAVIGGSDHRFNQVQAYAAPVQLGLPNSGAGDFQWMGGHISAGAAGTPNLYLAGGAGGKIHGVTIDNSATNLSSHVERNSGRWAIHECRLQNGSSHSFPVFQSDTDPATGDPVGGFTITDCDVSLSGSGVQFSCLINYVYTTAPAALNDVINVVDIQAFNIWRTDTATVTSGSHTVTDASIVSADNGSPLSSTQGTIPAGSFVGTVTNGVSFLISGSPSSQVNVNAIGSGTKVQVFQSAINTSSGAPILYMANGSATLPGGWPPPMMSRGIEYAGILQPEYPLTPAQVIKGQGDLITANGNLSTVRLIAGKANQVLYAGSSSASTLQWGSVIPEWELLNNYLAGGAFDPAFVAISTQMVGNQLYLGQYIQHGTTVTGFDTVCVTAGTLTASTGGLATIGLWKATAASAAVAFNTIDTASASPFTSTGKNVLNFTSQITGLTDGASYYVALWFPTAWGSALPFLRFPNSNATMFNVNSGTALPRGAITTSQTTFPNTALPTLTSFGAVPMWFGVRP